MQPAAAHYSSVTFARMRTLAATCLMSLLLLSTLLAAATRADEAPVYQQHIKPLLMARCIACHGVLKQESGLRLDTGLLIRQGGASGEVIRIGDAAASELIKRITSEHEDERMPPEGEPLSTIEIAHLTEWINSGAVSPEDEQPEQDPRLHWAFQPIARPPVPTTQLAGIQTAWGSSPIDAFVAAALEQQGLQPQAPATHLELIRRLYLDLVGVPPSLAELDQLAADDHEGWYARLVDRLLEDPRYGQRWGRHWMDVWRYSDWWGLGQQLRNSQMHIWHWRDWIVESLNQDLPYDEMLRSMLAADELYPTDQNRLRATGYLARNYFLFNRHQWMDETVEHVSKGFLGLTVNCAKCHDHKYDPISQVDYYRLRAFFEPYYVRMDMLPGEPDLARNGLPRVYETQAEAPTYLFVRGEETRPDKSSVIAPGLPEILASDALDIQPITLPIEAWQPERQAFVQQAYVKEAEERLNAATRALEAAHDQLAVATEKAISAQPADSKPADSKQADDKQADSKAVAELAARVRIATAELNVASQVQVSLALRLAAMRAAWQLDDHEKSTQPQATQPQATQPEATQPEATQLAAALQQRALEANRQAVVAQRQLEVAKAELKVVQSEFNLLKAAKDKRDAIEKELGNAREAFKNAQAAAQAEVKPDDKFQTIVGAQWSATRFLNSGADDPAISFGPQSSGRRTALAKWITAARNPLTARVAANHIWMRHTGWSLVPNVFDLGRKSHAPTHQALLDWLASELIDSGWSMKHLHRVIVNSQTYRLSSSTIGATDNLARDPDNQWHWRHNSQRMESQVVRDSVLALTGTLDLTAGGPPIMPDAQAASKRRSLYFFHSNNERNLFLTTFDEAAVKDCYRREQSIVPQQALALTNSQFILDAAGPIAQRIIEHLPAAQAVDDLQFIQQAFVYLLGIEASSAELARAQQALQQWRAVQAQDQSQRSPHELLVWALLNHTDFVTMR